MTIRTRVGIVVPTVSALSTAAPWPVRPILPAVMAPRTLRLNKNPDAGLIPERAYCETYETQGHLLAG